ncbi:MAG: nuclear transport factor 2 family protein [Bacteroidota bacterium]
MKQLLTFICLLLFTQLIQAQTNNSQSDLQEITATLMDYIEGTANGEPDRLRRAFHPNFNLYAVKNDSLQIRSGEQYISLFKPGKKSNRVGRIVSIDFEQDVATAKAEIIVPDWRIFTDYFLLVKYEGSWKIVHKSYTSIPYPKPEKSK